MTGAIRRTSVSKNASCTHMPFSSKKRWLIMGPLISLADMTFERAIKCMLVNAWASCLGRLARETHHRSNLFPFFDLFPLVSSEYKNNGTITICLPAAKDLRWCGSV